MYSITVKAKYNLRHSCKANILFDSAVLIANNLQIPFVELINL